MRRMKWMVLLAGLAVTATLGCSSQNEVIEQNQPAQPTVQSDVPPEVAAELANLSESDRQLAAQQRVCPVAGGLLGSMGTPEKLTVQGREVFICCEGCESKLRSDPEKYFAILDNPQTDAAENAAPE